jgi:isocitrate lyase
MPAKENGTRNVTQQKQPSSASSPKEMMSDQEQTAQYALAQDCMNYEWANNSRWKGIERPYSAEDVLRLRGSVHIEHTLARLGAERLWELLQT